MDDRRFDRMSRLLAVAGSRRAAVKAALAVALGGAALTADDAAARPALCRPAGRYCTSNRQCCNGKCRTGKRVPIASRNICDCDAPFGMCGKMCRDLSSDANNCGVCGNRVGPDERCCDGVPTPIGPENCGFCGDVCGPDDVCCPESGGCTDLQSDPNNCGACGTVCEDGECVDGACVGAGGRCGAFVPDANFRYCSTAVGETEVIGCDSEYFWFLPPSTVTTVPCSTNQDCIDLGSTYGLDCSNPSSYECFCEIGYFLDGSWKANDTNECSVTAKYVGGTCSTVPGIA